MVCLNENQVDEIRQLIEARGAEMEELTNDLLDHICCMIEDRMSLGIMVSVTYRMKQHFY